MSVVLCRIPLKLFLDSSQFDLFLIQRIIRCCWLTGSEGGLQGARTGSGTPICIFTANVSNVLLVGARRGTRKRPAAPTNSLKDKVAETRLGGFSVTESRRGTGTKEADLTGPGRNSKVGRVAPELQTKV